MAIKQQAKNGAWIFFDDTKLVRWVDAIGPDVVKFELSQGFPTDDTTGDPTQFNYTVTEAGTGNTTAVNAVTAGDNMLITTAANEYDGANIQLKGEKFKLVSGKPLYFGCKLKISDATQSDLFVGIAETDTTLMATSSAHAIALGGDGVFFSKLDGVTTLIFKNYLDGAETGTASYGTALDTAYHVYEFYYDGESVKGYIDNTLVGTFTASLGDGDMTPSINVRAGEAAAITSNIAWMRCIQLR
jgi:hypothetical protein